MSDFKCRNCSFRFIPTFWVQGSSPNDLVGQCPRCQSNATHEMNSTDNASYEIPKTTDGKIRLDE